MVINCLNSQKKCLTAEFLNNTIASSGVILLLHKYKQFVLNPCLPVFWYVGLCKTQKFKLMILYKVLVDLVFHQLVSLSIIV